MPRKAITERSATGLAPKVSAPRFVGRAQQLTALAAALSSSSAVVLVEGEAGVGKSRLVREFLASAPAGRPVLLALCPPLREPQTLGPLTDAIRQAAVGRVAELKLSALAGALRPLFPDWADKLPPALESSGDPGTDRHRVFAALAEFLAALGVGVLVVEDLHWADEATVEFLLFLASREPRQVSVLVTCRPEDVPEGALLRRLARLAAGSTGVRLTLGPLDAAQTGELVSSMLAGAEVSDRFAAFVHERTDGVPLAVEESVRLMGERADLVVRDGAWARRHLTDIEVPPTVRDAVLERAARLGDDVVSVLRAVAVVGEPADEPLLEAAAGLARERVRAGCAQALGCGLLTEGVVGRRGLVFRHELAARAVYEAIPAPLRRELHQRAGMVLAGRTPLPLAQLARHFREAGDDERWLRYAEQAAGQALAVGDQPTAAALLQNLVTEADLPAEAALRLVRQIPLSALVAHAPVMRIIDRLRSLLQDAALRPAERAEAGFQLARLLLNADEHESGMAELERVIAGRGLRPCDAAWAMVTLGWPIGTLWPAAVHQRWLDRGWAAAQDATMPDEDRLVLAVNRATALLDLGEEAGWDAADGLPTEASDPRQALQVARGLMNTGEAAMQWGRYGEARRRLCAGLEVAEQHDFPRLHGQVLALLTRLDWLTGTWSGLPGQAATLTRYEEPQTRMHALLVSGFLDLAAGLDASGEEKLQLAISAIRERGWIDYQAEPSASLARLSLAGGQAGSALAVTEEPMQVIANKQVWLWATDIAPVRVQALTVLGRNDEATELTARFASGLHGRNAPAPRAALLLCRATLAEAAGQHVRAATAFNRAADAWQALPRPYDAMLAREHQARCLIIAGQRDPGLSLLVKTQRELDTLGASADARRVASALREQGVTVRRGWRGGRHGYGDQLSPRELEVVRLVITGSSNREIGDALSRSPKTVGAQVKSAMRKLGASSRTALALRAVEYGIGPDGQAHGFVGKPAVTS